MDTYSQISTWYESDIDNTYLYLVMYVFYIGFWFLLCLIISKSIQCLFVAFISVSLFAINAVLPQSQDTHRASADPLVMHMCMQLTPWLPGSLSYQPLDQGIVPHLRVVKSISTSNKSPPKYMVEERPPRDRNLHAQHLGQRQARGSKLLTKHTMALPAQLGMATTSSLRCHGVCRPSVSPPHTCTQIPARNRRAITEHRLSPFFPSAYTSKSAVESGRGDGTEKERGRSGKPWDTRGWGKK